MIDQRVPPNGPMTCADFEESLGAYLEGDLDAATSAAAERHRVGCPHCAGLAAHLERITARAAELPTLRPSRDLWPGIAGRIDASVVEFAGQRMAASARQSSTRRWAAWPHAAAAAALVAVTAGVTYEITARSMSGVPNDGGPPVAAAEPASSTGVAAAAMAGTGATPARTPVGRAESAPGRSAAMLVSRRAASAPRPGEAVYDEEITVLRAALQQRRDDLDPATVAILERNIGVIDAAIRQSRQALARDPRSPFLGDQLNRALDRKVHLLRTAASLPTRT